jgi:hypothetical protein
MASRPKLKTTPDERAAQEYCKYFEQRSRGSRSFSARGSASRWLLSYGDMYLAVALEVLLVGLASSFGSARQPCRIRSPKSVRRSVACIDCSLAVFVEAGVQRMLLAAEVHATFLPETSMLPVC